MDKASENILRHVPPHSIEAEQAILGGILGHAEALDVALENLRPNDFYAEKHRTIFKVMIALKENQVGIDLITTYDAIRSRGNTDILASYLAEIMDNVPSSANIKYYATIVHEKAILRRLIETSTRIASECYNGASEHVPQFLDQVEQEILSVGENRLSTPFYSAADLMFPTIAVIEDICKRKSSVNGVPSGLKDLDNLTMGFQPSDLVIIAARPSHGKSALGFEIAQHAAFRSKTSAGIFSLEMSKEQIMLRLIASESRVDLAKIRSGYLNDQDFVKIAHATAVIGNENILIDDSAAISVLEIKAKARRMKREHNIGIIVIDYLQLISADGKIDNRNLEISQISRSLKALAKELSIPVIALSQLNRDLERRTDKRPRLSDLRDGGSIEQDSDVCIFIYRDEMYNPNSPDAGTAEIIIGKQRNGPVGTVRAAFCPEHVRFDNLARV